MILNLGCGSRTSERCVNIDRSIHVRIARYEVLFRLAQLFLSADRVRHIEALRSNVVEHDLAKGIPYPDGSVEAIYQSYMLQHIDRDLGNPESDPVIQLLRESYRVLKTGGVLRIVVPDFESHCRRYVQHLDACRSDSRLWAANDGIISHIVGMAVRKEASGSSRQRPILRWAENLLLGDARRRGETHQWEYDEFNLAVLLRRAGFSRIERRDFTSSLIPDWNDIGLDRTADGGEYKADSLYVEAVR